MNIEFDAYKVKLNEVKPALDGLADSLKVSQWYSLQLFPYSRYSLQCSR